MELVTTAIIGALCIVLGVLHFKGNVKLLHSYHTKRVAEEDKPLLGKGVGTGVIILGASLILFGALNFLSTKLNLNALNTIANVVLIIGLVVGLGIAIFTIIKYNKGLF